LSFLCWLLESVPKTLDDALAQFLEPEKGYCKFPIHGLQSFIS